jgi:hypothetical protein
MFNTRTQQKLGLNTIRRIARLKENCILSVLETEI